MNIRKKLISICVTLVMIFSLTLSIFGLGYGQGKIVDGENRPVGALDFNSAYGKYDAYGINENDNRIILSFDQGYENGYTEKILDTLKEKGVTAIFFLTGDYAAKEEKLVRRMIDEGHIIGNHGMKHISLGNATESEIKTEIESIEQLITEKYGIEMSFLRPPCGEFSEESLKTTQDMGYTTLFWSFAYVDWYTDKQPEPTQALQTLTNALHPGAVYLLHSVSSTNAEILGDFIDNARSAGFEF